MLYLYGKWTEGLRSCDPLLYEDAHEKLRRETRSPLGNSGHKRMLAKLHSLKVGAFKPVHQVSPRMLLKTVNKELRCRTNEYYAQQKLKTICRVII